MLVKCIATIPIPNSCSSSIKLALLFQDCIAFGNILHYYESRSLVTSIKGRRKEDRNRVSCRGKVHCIYRNALDKAEQRRLLLVCTYI